MKKITVIMIVSLIMLLLLFSGCHKKRVGDDDKDKKETTMKTDIEEEIECESPKVAINDECCIDDDDNGACDKYEMQEDGCGDGVCDEFSGENSCTCQDDCGVCEDKAAHLCQEYYCSNDECITERKASCCGDGVCGSSESCSSCFQDCCELNSEMDGLSTYPEMIVGWDTIVGDKAPPEDVVIAADILTHVAMENLTVGEGKLASEVDLTLHNNIVVGHPCDNAAAAELWKKEIVENNGSCKVFENGDSIVKLFPTSSTKVALYVGGYTPIDTERASKLLINYEDFDMSGDTYQIEGSRSEPVPYIVS